MTANTCSNKKGLELRKPLVELFAGNARVKEYEQFSLAWKMLCRRARMSHVWRASNFKNKSFFKDAYIAIHGESAGRGREPTLSRPFRDVVKWVESSMFLQLYVALKDNSDSVEADPWAVIEAYDQILLSKPDNEISFDMAFSLARFYATGDLRLDVCTSCGYENVVSIEHASPLKCGCCSERSN